MERINDIYPERGAGNSHKPGKRYCHHLGWIRGLGVPESRVHLTIPDAGADWIEPLIGPCGYGCVHADWRKTDTNIYNYSQ